MDSVADQLASRGVAVIPGLLTQDECNTAISGVWDAFEASHTHNDGTVRSP